MLHLSAERLLNFKSIVLVCHSQPDGDAMGSMLGLAHVLADAGKKVVCIAPDSPPFFLDFLPGRSQVIQADFQLPAALEVLNAADLVIALDHGHPSRTGEQLSKWFLHEKKSPVWVIDHHPDPWQGYDAYFHTIQASSTSELVVSALQGFTLTKEAATCFMTGLVTDTGGFRHAIFPETFPVAAALQAAGAPYQEVMHYVFDQQSPERLQLLGYVLSEKLTWVANGKIAIMGLSFEELQRFHSRKGDTEGMVNYPLSVQGAEVAIMLTERDAGTTRISFRSKGNIPVNQFASQFFEGGGHLNAAGGRYAGNMQDTLSYMEACLLQFFSAWYSS
jgi:phosphoesterase RecJ-like protein